MRSNPTVLLRRGKRRACFGRLMQLGTAVCVILWLLWLVTRLEPSNMRSKSRTQQAQVTLPAQILRSVFNSRGGLPGSDEVLDEPHQRQGIDVELPPSGDRPRVALVSAVFDTRDVDHAAALVYSFRRYACRHAVGTSAEGATHKLHYLLLIHPEVYRDLADAQMWDTVVLRWVHAGWTIIAVVKSAAVADGGHDLSARWGSLVQITMLCGEGWRQSIAHIAAHQTGIGTHTGLVAHLASRGGPLECGAHSEAIENHPLFFVAHPRIFFLKPNLVPLVGEVDNLCSWLLRDDLGDERSKLRPIVEWSSDVHFKLRCSCFGSPDGAGLHSRRFDETSQRLQDVRVLIGGTLSGASSDGALLNVLSVAERYVHFEMVCASNPELPHRVSNLWASWIRFHHATMTHLQRTTHAASSLLHQRHPITLFDVEVGVEDHWVGALADECAATAYAIPMAIGESNGTRYLASSVVDAATSLGDSPNVTMAPNAVVCAMTLRWYAEVLEDFASDQRAAFPIGEARGAFPPLLADAHGNIQLLLAMKTAPPGVIRLLTKAQIDTRRNVSTAALSVYTSETGASCLSTCSLHRLGCAPAALKWWVPNSCSALDRIFTQTPPHDGVKHCSVELSLGVSPGIAPALRVSDGVAVVSDSRVAVGPPSSCAAAVEGWKRACTCIDPTAASTAEVVPLTTPRYRDLVGEVDEKGHQLGDEEHHGAQVDSDATSSADHAGKPDHISSHRCPCRGNAFANATEEEEQQCLEYLSAFENVERMEPMRNDVKFGRTAKMRVMYRNPCITAILKPPQASFPLEPYAEYAAFELDRMLALKRIPPTTWLFVPLMALEASLDRQATKGRSSSSFAQWFAEEVGHNAVRSRLLVPDPATGRMMLGCSIQLALRDVRWHGGSYLSFDDTYLDLLTPERAASYNAQRPATSWSNDTHVQRVILKTAARREHVDEVLRYLSDAMVLDTIIGNDDRSAQKNSNIYPVVGSPVSPDEAYRFALLDQGKSFYRDTVKGLQVIRVLESPLFGLKRNNDGAVVCMFRRETRDRLMSFMDSASFTLRMKEILPKAIYTAIGERRLGWAEVRLEHLKVYMEQCRSLIGAAAFPWP